MTNDEQVKTRMRLVLFDVLKARFALAASIQGVTFGLSPKVFPSELKGSVREVNVKCIH